MLPDGKEPLFSGTVEESALQAVERWYTQNLVGDAVCLGLRAQDGELVVAAIEGRLRLLGHPEPVRKLVAHVGQDLIERRLHQICHVRVDASVVIRINKLEHLLDAQAAPASATCL